MPEVFRILPALFSIRQTVVLVKDFSVKSIEDAAMTNIVHGVRLPDEVKRAVESALSKSRRDRPVLVRRTLREVTKAVPNCEIAGSELELHVARAAIDLGFNIHFE
jgi:predicted transcriptional regulator